MKALISKAPSRLSRTILSRPERVEALCRELRSLLRAKRLGKIAFRVELIARECLVNAVKHGNHGEEQKRVTMRLWFAREDIRLQVGDEGEGFNWRRVLRRRPAGPRETTGRGLGLMGVYAERVRFNARGNLITLWFRRRPEAQTT